MQPIPAKSADDDARIVLDEVRRLVRFLRGTGPARDGLSPAQIFVLQVLAAEPSLSVNDLAARTHTHQSSVSVVAKRLVARGLVARRSAADDARRVELTLTAKGRRAVSRRGEAPQIGLLRAVRALSPRDRRVLVVALSALLARLGVPAGPPPMLFEEGSRSAGS